MMMRMRSDDDTFSAGQISPPDSTGGSDWAVRQLSAEVKEREKRLMRLQLCSSTGTPAAAPTTSQNNPRARKQPGTGAKHQPMTSHQFPQPPTPNPLVVKSFPPVPCPAARRASTCPPRRAPGITACRDFSKTPAPPCRPDVVRSSGLYAPGPGHRSLTGALISDDSLDHFYFLLFARN